MPIRIRGGRGSSVGLAQGGGGSDTLLFALNWRNDGGSTASGQRLRRTVGFAPGAVPDGMFPEVRKADGSTAYTRQQFDNVTYWPDDSMKAAVLTVEQEDDVLTTATQADEMWAVGETAASNTSAISDANLKALAYTFVITAGGTDYTFSVSDAIDDGHIRDFAIGPVERQVRVFGFAENSGTPNTALFCLGWISLLRDGTTSAAAFRLVSHWNENYSGSASAPGTGTITALRIKKSGSDVQAFTSLSYNLRGGGAQDVREDDFSAVWTANAPTLRPLFDVPQMFAARLVPPFSVRAGVIAEIGDPAADTLTPFSAYDVTPTIGDTGGRPDIGLMPGWVVTALITNKQGLRQQALANDAGMCSVSKNFYNSTNGELVVARDETYGSVVGNPNVSATGNSNAQNYLDNTAGNAPVNGNDYYHYSQAAYGAYLLSGEPWHFESALADATSAPMVHDQAYRTETFTPSGDVYKSVADWAYGPRSGAWATNCVLNCRHIIPAAHPLHDYVQDIAADNIGFIESQVKTANMPAEAQALGIPIRIVEKGWGGWTTRWFQWNFVACTFGMEALRGGLSMSSRLVTEFITKCYFGAGDPTAGGCPARCDSYTINFTVDNGSGGANSDLAQGWDHVAVAESGSWNDTTKLIPSGGCPSSGTMTDVGIGSPHGFPTYKRAAAILWAAAGLDVAQDAAEYIEPEWEANGPTEEGLATNPQFDLEMQ